MRTSDSRAGFTLVEAIVVVAILGWLVAMLLPDIAISNQKTSRIGCKNNLKQIGSAYRIWASDSGDRFPAAVPRSEGGWRDFLTNGNAGPYCWTNYAVLANELGQAPRVLICPADVRKPAGFNPMANCNVSYFVGVSASDSYPNSILGGDRNLGPGSTPRDDYGFSLKNDSGNDVVIQTNRTSAYSWSLKMHSAGKPKGEECGNILLGDGRVHVVTSATFRNEYQPNAGVPRLEDLTNSPGQLPPPGADFRLVFP